MIKKIRDLITKIKELKEADREAYSDTLVGAFFIGYASVSTLVFTLMAFASAITKKKWGLVDRK